MHRCVFLPTGSIVSLIDVTGTGPEREQGNDICNQPYVPFNGHVLPH